MRFGEVDIPQDVIDAHRCGRLVLFVGAGASLDGPSSLPLFRELAIQIANGAGFSLPESFDPTEELGKLADSGVGVAAQVAKIIGNQTSTPNRLHVAIAGLMASAKTARIVTTNYDPHLSTALAEMGVSHHEFAAPALPLGDAFDGVVYLHGSVHHPASQLVITDKDFGGAYLLSAWAARFLERMFSKYTVLFIGYSHTDVVMKFIGRALRNRNRYILTAAPDDPMWLLMGIAPIAYRPPGSGPHEQVIEAIERLAAHSQMGLVEHRQRVAALVASPPPLSPQDDSYLEAIISSGETVPLFTAVADRSEWLEWIRNREPFASLLDQSTEPTECTTQLAHWFAERFLFDEERIDTAVAVVDSSQSPISTALWQAIAWRLHADPGSGSVDPKLPRPLWQRPLIPRLIAGSPSNVAGPWLEYALRATDFSADRASAVLLLDHLLEPVARSSARLSLFDSLDVGIRGDGYEIGEAWNRAIRPQLDDDAEELLVICERHLRLAARMLMTATGHDALAYTPRTMSDAGFPHRRFGLDALITITRDLISHLISSNTVSADQFVRRWAKSGLVALQRLTIDTVSHRIDLTSDEKIAWIAGRHWVWIAPLHSDIVAFIEKLDSDASDQGVAGLLSEIEDDETGIDDPARERSVRFGMVALLADSTDTALSTASRERRIAEHPELSSRAATASLPRFTAHFRSPRPPMDAEELHQLLADDPAGAASELLRFKGNDLPLEQTGWSDVVGLIAGTVASWPMDGFTLVDSSRGDSAVASAVMRGWAATSESAVAEQIMARVSTMNFAENVGAIVELLSPWAPNRFAWEALPSARSLAERCWVDLLVSRQNVADEPDESSMTVKTSTNGTALAEPSNCRDWLTSSLNDPAGKLAYFWIKAVQHDWKATGDNFGGFDDQIVRALGGFLAGDTPSHQLAQVQLGSQLHYLFGADPVWATNHLLPLFAWGDGNEDRAARTWQGFLVDGRWNDALLDLGLLDAYGNAIEHTRAFGQEEREGLANDLVEMMLFSTKDRSGTLDLFTAQVDVSLRSYFISQVAWVLDQWERSAADEQWDRWMRQYWTARAVGSPRVLAIEEQSALAAWAHVSLEHFVEAVDLVLASDARLPDHILPKEIVPEDIVEAHPNEAISVLTHLLSNTNPDTFYADYELIEIADAARGNVEEPQFQRFVEQMIRFGILDAK